MSGSKNSKKVRGTRMNQGVLFQVVEKREYVKNGDSFKDCAVDDVYGNT